MMVDSMAFMKSVASDVKSEFGEFVTIDEHGPVGSVDYEINFTPRDSGAARIQWFVICDTFTICVSPRLEWQSQEWIHYEGDNEADRELSQGWSQDLIWRIIGSGARYVRTRSLLPSFMRSTYVTVGDEAFDRPHAVLESWKSWRQSEAVGEALRPISETSDRGMRRRARASARGRG
ncbi:MAG: hypothetical protein P0Y60_04900 [Candidatus Microbacterium colombiense]|nr:MAG: hypothetical protein P0Y60_04900 [Microbacterium sp.]